MKRKILIVAALLVVSFTFGIMFASFVQEGAYQLKEWIDKGTRPPATTMQVILYFYSPEKELLAPVKRNIPVQEAVSLQMRAVIQELIDGPHDAAYSHILPPGTKIRAVYTRENTVYVDFFAPLIEEHPGGTFAELMSIYSIVNTLLENFPDCTQVQILIDGKPQQTLAGHIDIRKPLMKDEQLAR